MSRCLVRVVQHLSRSLSSQPDHYLVDCIERLEQSKKHGRPIGMQLRPNFDLLAQMKTLTILFLDGDGESFVLLYGL